MRGALLRWRALCESWHNGNLQIEPGEAAVTIKAMCFDADGVVVNPQR